VRAFRTSAAGAFDAIMKIVINALSARIGGGQTYLKNLLARLPERADLEVHVFAPASLSLPVDARIRRRTTRWPTGNPVLRTLWEVLVLPMTLARERPEVLFCPGGVIASLTPPRCRTVTMFRNMMPFDSATVSRIPFGLQWIRNHLLRRSMLRSMATADLTIFISNYARRLIEGQIRVANAITIPHGISQEFRTSDRDLERPKWLPKGDYLLFVSRFEVHKHQREVAEAFCALPTTLRDKYHMILVGDVSVEKAREISAIARRFGAEGLVVMTGPVAYAELPAVYHHAAAHIFASSCENCPNILLEAMGSGRPLLSSNVMPMPEFGADAAEYFSPTDPVSIQRALRRVLEDGAHADRLGRLAAARSEEFDWGATARKTWQCILDLALAPVANR
jgi:glycosyltransferase involved in cell wall biosynthesis